MSFGPWALASFCEYGLFWALKEIFPKSMIMLTWCRSPMKWSHVVWKICPQQSGNERVGPDKWSFTLGYQTLACYPLKYLHMERNCTPRPKIISQIRILRKWKFKLEDLGVLTPYTSYKGRAYIYEIFVSSI